MVEIKPYIDDDDEDQSNWVPLTASSHKPMTNEHVGNMASEATAADEPYANQKTCGGVNSDMNINSNMNQQDDKSVQRAYVSKGSQDSLVLLENIHDDSEGEEEDDDDCGWQKISSTTATDVPNQVESWSWSKQLINHLTTTHTCKISTAATSSIVVEDVASDDDGDDKIVWQKPNKLEDDAVEKSRRRRHEIERKNVIEQEYDDVPTTKPKRMVRQQELKEQPLHHDIQVQQVMDDYDNQWKRCKQNEEEKLKPSAPPRFQHIPSQQQQQQSHKQRQQRITNDDDPPSVKTKLQQTFIHDPLCALPFCFLKHLYYETKLQLALTWEVYFEYNELQSVLAPLVLIVLIGMFGIALVGCGLYQLVMFVARSGMYALLSFGKWMIRYVLTMGYQLLWSSLYSCVVLGLGVWVWSKARETPLTTEEMTNKKASTSWKVPSISTIVPWTIALSSPALYEAVIIILSLRTILPILIPSGTGFDNCDAEEELYCLADSNQQSTSSHGMSSIAVSVVILLFAAINAYVVLVAAKMMDQKARQTKELEESSFETSTVEANNSSSSLYIARLHKSYELIQRHVGICHTISVITLAVTSMLVLLVQTLYIHYQKEGGRNVLATIVNQMGTVGFNTLCIGLGIFVLVTLRNITINAITSSDTIVRVSFGKMSRSALKKAIIEISSNAVWSSDDIGSSLLGILSDDDGALRLAILEWIIERWTESKLSSEEQAGAASSTSQDATPTPTSVDDDSSHNPSMPNNDDDSSHDPSMPNNSTENIDQSGINSGDSSGTTSNGTPHEQVFPSYQSLQGLIAKLDADETLETIQRYRSWVFSLPPSRNAATCVAIWKMCPAIAILMFNLGFTLIGGLLSYLGAFYASNSLFGIGLLIFAILSPLISLEYIRVSRWWMKTSSHLKKLEYETQSNNERMQRDLVMILLRADAADDDQPGFLFDTSSFLLRIWFLLLESISVLQSSVPVVRCATVASAAADLTTNTICLVDLALEVKKRGLIGGAGMLIFDAFQHHLSKELEQRKQETSDTGSDEARGTSETDDTEEEELGGQYTGAVMSAVGNVGKISHNVSCLVKSGSRNKEENDAKGESSNREPPHPADKGDNTRNDNKSQSDIPKSEPSRTPENVKEAPSPTTINQDEQEEMLLQEKSCENNSDDNGGLMPFLVGGIALVGAMAGGVAVHAASNKNGQGLDERRKKDK